MQIGSFFRTAKGYEGIIETATLDIRISIVPRRAERRRQGAGLACPPR